MATGCLLAKGCPHLPGKGRLLLTRDMMAKVPRRKQHSSGANARSTLAAFGYPNDLKKDKEKERKTKKKEKIKRELEPQRSSRSGASFPQGLRDPLGWGEYCWRPNRGRGRGKKEKY